VTDLDALLEETTEDLFEHAPCGYLSTSLDGTILRVNRTFEAWTGLRREDLLGRRRFQDLLSPGGRIYHETHVAPLLRMQGSVREIAVDLVRADGSRLPALVNSVVRSDAEGRPRVVRTTIFDASDRRRYEQELVRAREREHEIALGLQLGLLSGRLPSGDGVELGVAYRPAEGGLEVGGDWYDAFALDAPFTVGVVVGDVVGRGLDAAAVMGQLRSAVRALATTGLAPGALLTALDRYAARHAVGQMATVVYAEVDAAASRVTYACAGHLPPVVVEPGSLPRCAWDGRSAPLDARAGSEQRPQAALDLAPGSTVVLCTDGLIERRGRPLDAGLEALLAGVEAGRHLEPDALAEHLLGELPAAGAPRDDVCVLVATLGAPR
jgi:sigma-B regulation protein RsbU (phosphoserine phosphatase)